MDLRQLRYFVGIAESGSIMKASERLNVAQPALSVQLANMEAELGVTLVVRSNRGITLTENGKLLYERALTTLRYHEESIRSLKEGKNVPRGTVSLGIPSNWPDLLAAPLYKAMREELPGVRLYLATASTAILYEWLQAGRIDLAMLFNIPENTGYEVSPLRLEEFFLLSPPNADTDPSREEQINFDDIFDLPLIMPCRSTVWRKMLDTLADKRGKMFSPLMETDTCEIGRAVVKAGEAHAVMPRSGFLEAIADGSVRARRIVNPVLDGVLSLVHHPSTGLGLAQRHVRDIVIRLVRGSSADWGISSRPDVWSRSLQSVPSSILPAARPQVH